MDDFRAGSFKAWHYNITSPLRQSIARRIFKHNKDPTLCRIFIITFDLRCGARSGLPTAAAPIAAKASIAATTTAATTTAATAIAITTTSAAAAAGTSATTPASFTAFDGASFVDFDGPAFQILVIQSGNGRLSFGAVRHFYKAKASGLAGKLVFNDRG
jgi:hypothetical protein